MKNVNSILLFTIFLIGLINPPIFSQGENDDDPPDNDFMIIVKGGKPNLARCIDYFEPNSNFFFTVALSNLVQNPLPCDLVVGLSITSDQGFFQTIYSDPLIFECSNLSQTLVALTCEACQGTEMTRCKATPHFNYLPFMFNDICGNSGEGQIDVEFTLSLHWDCDDGNYSLFEPENTDCYGYIPPCIDVSNGTTVSFSNCIDCPDIDIDLPATTNGRHDSLENDASVQVFPIPASDQIEIISSGYQFDRIINAYGQVYSINNRNTDNFINIEHLPIGLYYLVLNSKDGQVLKPFMKI